MKSSNPSPQYSATATSRSLVAAIVVVSILLLVATGILVILLRGRAHDTGTVEPPSASLPTKSGDALLAPAPDAGPTRSSPRIAEAGADAAGEASPAGNTQGGLDGDVYETGPITYDFGAPQPEGELAKVLSALSDDVRRCAELREGYRPKNLSVHLIRSENARASERDRARSASGCRDLHKPPRSQGHVIH